MNEILLIDNIDSFIYNLVDQLRYFGYKVIIFRNNVPLITIVKHLTKMNNPILILSPGPGKPQNAGCMPQILNTFKGKIPIFGICLGHQAIIESYGGKIIQSNEILHGKSSLINHDGKAMFKGLTNPLMVARYHSLVSINAPKLLTINATFNNIIMGIRNDKDRICSFQFHPESILTTQGGKLLRQTLNWMLR